MTELIQVATLDKTAFPRLEICRRVYSPEGIAPTIHTCGGGGHRTQDIGGDPPREGISRRAYIGGGFHMTLSIYGTDGLCPTQWANQGKDPIKVVLE